VPSREADRQQLEEGRPVHLDFLRPMYDEIGDYVSVYLDTDRSSEHSGDDIAIRWQHAREQLAEAGASGESLQAVAEVISDQDRVARGQAVFARRGAVTFAAALDGPPRRQIARLAPLPHLMPLLAQHRPPIPHLRVSATRTGGEIVAIGGSGKVWRDWVAGQQWPVHKAKVGGWSQDSHQRDDEDTWNSNAKELAAEAAKVATAIGAGHVVVGGDVRARTMFVNHLPKLLRGSAVVVDDEVTADSQILAGAADRALAGWAESEARERFDAWQAERAHGRGVDGLARTMTAFRNGQVADLLLFDDPTSTATAAIGPGDSDIAASANELLELGLAENQIHSDRADAALVRAAVRTDAELHFLPADLVQRGDPTADGGIAMPRDGVAAAFRFSLEEA
jgi:Bacterial archaeo-eukaryotic release factor family 2